MPVGTLSWKTCDWKFPGITSEKEFLFRKKDVSLEELKNIISKYGIFKEFYREITLISSGLIAILFHFFDLLPFLGKLKM